MRRPRFAAAFALVLALSPWASAADAWKIGDPIATYWAGPGYPGGGPLDDESAARLAAEGFNVAWATAAELDVAHRHHLRALLHDPLISPDALRDPKRREALTALVDRVRGHPALYAYHIVDEPTASAFPALGELVAFLRDRDPAHLGAINLLPVYANNQQFGVEGPQVEAYAEHLRRFAETVRPGMLSYDHYQLTRGGDNPQFFLNLAMVRDRALASGIPFQNIVQASSWVPGSAASPGSPRLPDPDELRFLVYSTLAYGGQGVSYYVYRYPAHEGGLLNTDNTPTPLGREAAALNRAFVAIAREVRPLRPLAAQHAGMHPPDTQPLPASGQSFTVDPPIADEPYKPGDRVRGVVVGRFGPEGGPAEGTHAVVVNLDYRADRTVGFKGPGPLDVFDPATGRWNPAGDRVELALRRGAGALVRVRPKSP